jgi:hypothetical protein
MARNLLSFGFALAVLSACGLAKDKAPRIDVAQLGDNQLS